jgi:pectate lyase
MKKQFLSLAYLAFSLFSLQAQTPDFSICGYAAMDGGTTGGAGGPVVVPTTFDELQAYATGTNPVVILIDREFKGPNVLRIGSNKTIFGVGTKGFINQIGFSIQCQHNIIIKNLRFTMTGVPITNNGENKIAGFNFDPDCMAIQADDANLPAAEQISHHIWVDHCEFFNEDPYVMTDKDRYDGLLDMKNNVTNVTISWNYFHDHHKGCLFGKGNSDDFDRTVTMKNNKFETILSRIPLQRFGKLHMVNNYILDCPDGNGLNVRINSNAYVESNYFDNVKKPIFGKPSEGGKALLKDNVFKDCGVLPSIITSSLSPNSSPLNSSEEFDPSSYVPPYTCTAGKMAVADVPTKVTTYSGIGKITAPSPTVTSLEEDQMNHALFLYPNPTEGQVQLSRVVKWTLTNTLGETVLYGESSQLDLSSYPPGLYFLSFGDKVQKIQKR